MGLLSYLSQLAPFQAPPDRVWAPQQQPLPLQQPPSVPRFQPMQAPADIPQAQALSPLAQLAPAPQTPQMQIRPPTWSERFDTALQSPMLNMGLSLLGNAQRGGDWGQVARDMQGFQQQQQQRQLLERQTQREDAQDRRNDMVFGRQQTAWQREDQQLERWRAAVQGEQDPVRRATLEAIGPEGYGEWMAGEQQRAFQAREGQLDRETQIRAAGIRSANENSLGRYFQSMDAQTLGELNQRAAQIQATVLPQLRNLRGTIVQAGTSLTGQPIDYNSRITLGRYFNGSSEDRMTLEVWRARILGPALEQLRGMGAMSEREMEAAMNSMSNPNMTLGAAMQLIDERIAQAERQVATARAAGTYFNDAHGLTGVQNSAGQDWPTYLQTQIGDMPGTAQTPQTEIPRGGYPQPSPDDVALLLRDTSAERRRFFDQVYGPGAAERAIAGNRSRWAATPGAWGRRGAD